MSSQIELNQNEKEIIKNIMKNHITLDLECDDVSIICTDDGKEKWYIQVN